MRFGKEIPLFLRGRRAIGHFDSQANVVFSRELRLLHPVLFTATLPSGSPGAQQAASKAGLEFVSVVDPRSQGQETLELKLRSKEPPWLDLPAMMRMVVTTPNVLKNQRPEWLGPFNFFLFPLLV